MIPVVTGRICRLFTRRKRMYSLLEDFVESSDSQYEIVSALLGTPGDSVYVLSGYQKVDRGSCIRYWLLNTTVESESISGLRYVAERSPLSWATRSVLNVI